MPESERRPFLKRNLHNLAAVIRELYFSESASLGLVKA